MSDDNWPGVKPGFAIVIRNVRNEPLVAIDDPVIIRAVLQLLLDHFGLDIHSRPKSRQA